MGPPVVQQLPVGGVEVLVLALVLPAEEAPLPHVRPAVAAAALGRAALEGERLPRLVHFDGLGMANKLAEVKELLVRGLLLGKFNVAPFEDELEGVHWIGTQESI